MQTGNNVEHAVQMNASSLRNHAAKSTNDGKELGKQDFLNLLMTQMANQDPMDPMDSQGMMQQLASLGTVEQLQNLNSQTAKMMEIQQHIARSTVGSMLGKDVEVGAREIPLNNGDTIPVTYKLEGSAERVMLLVHDSTGEMIREINLESRAQGAHEFAWDGRDNDGDMMPNGDYSYNVFARTEGGEEVGVTLTKSGQVSMVRFEGSDPLLKINGEWVPAKEIVGMGNKSKLRYQSAVPLPARIELMTRKTPVWSSKNSE
jgi:flagellar basal-body rod modification protein FlgD